MTYAIIILLSLIGWFISVFIILRNYSYDEDHDDYSYTHHHHHHDDDDGYYRVHYGTIIAPFVIEFLIYLSYIGYLICLKKRL